jgi:hypothetical protein
MYLRIIEKDLGAVQYFDDRTARGFRASSNQEKR